MHSHAPHYCLIALCIVLFALLNLCGCKKKTAIPIQPPSPTASVPTADFMSKQEQVKNGMSPDEVTKLVGGVQGQEVTMPAPSNPPEGYKAAKMYQWADSNGNLLICHFVDNKLVFKQISKPPSGGK